MSFLRRRLTFQLTPLLDLLLIVIFAQFMDVQQNAQRLRQLSESERRQLAAQAEALQADYQQRADQLDQQYRQRFDEFIRRQQQADQQLAELLDLPQQVTNEIARLRAGQQVGSATQMQALADRLRDQLSAQGQPLMHMLVQLDEMQKHVTFWRLHLTTNGQAVLSDGARERRFVFASEAEFIERTFQASKSFPEPKTLVLILLSYGDTQARFRRDAMTGLPKLTERLRRDDDEARWYDFSLLGFRPSGVLE